ncbi:hypothetical protein ACFHYQ_25640 [Sphaerimonospora cavernae]|uniref:Methyl-accepting chemotaxis protein n=1 Tax=Sphaerimonospora cavernae TaxID=1740611 RepID=A0ABV6UC30_9ACTN
MTDQKLASELLRDLAALPELQPRAKQLQELSRAIMTPNQAEQWCEVDLFAAFPPSESVRPAPEGSRWHWLLKIISLVQPVLVFLPIAVTWYGLKDATTAYGEALATGGVEAARRPFLEMWQQGFDGRLAGWLRFDNVAQMTLGVIGVLIVVTLADRLLQRTVEQRADEQAERIRGRLLGALTRATLVLSQVRLSSPARFQAELTRSAAEMHRMGETIGKVHTQVMESLNTALDATGQATAALKTGVADVQRSIKTLDEHLTAVTSSAETLLQAVERTGYAIDSVGERTDAAVGRVGDRLGDVILDAARGVQRTLDEMTALTGQTMKDVAASTGQAVQDMTHATGQAVQDMTHATGQAVRETAKDLDSRIGELVSTTAGLGSAVDRMEAAATLSGDRISRVLDRLRRRAHGRVRAHGRRGQGGPGRLGGDGERTRVAHRDGLGHRRTNRTPAGGDPGRVEQPARAEQPARTRGPARAERSA